MRAPSGSSTAWASANPVRRELAALLRTARSLPPDAPIAFFGHRTRMGAVADELAARLGDQSRLYAPALDACAAIRAWRRAAWRPAATPAAIRWVRHFGSRRAAVDVGLKLAPEAGGSCDDPVFAVLDPADVFCG